MELEFAITPAIDDFYPFEVCDGSPLVIDWQPAIIELLRENDVGIVAAKFHNTLSEMIVTVARRVGQPRVVLSGGCFQNRYLTERTIERLSAEGFRPYWHQRVPPNDGGISLGQIYAAAMTE